MPEGDDSDMGEADDWQSILNKIENTIKLNHLRDFSYESSKFTYYFKESLSKILLLRVQFTNGKINKIYDTRKNVWDFVIAFYKP